jgi:hypothetical protein
MKNNNNNEISTYITKFIKQRILLFLFIFIANISFLFISVNVYGLELENLRTLLKLDYDYTYELNGANEEKHFLKSNEYFYLENLGKIRPVFVYMINNKEDFFLKIENLELNKIYLSSKLVNELNITSSAKVKLSKDSYSKEYEAVSINNYISDFYNLEEGIYFDFIVLSYETILENDFIFNIISLDDEPLQIKSIYSREADIIYLLIRITPFIIISIVTLLILFFTIFYILNQNKNAFMFYLSNRYPRKFFKIVLIIQTLFIFFLLAIGSIVVYYETRMFSLLAYQIISSSITLACCGLRSYKKYGI